MDPGLIGFLVIVALFIAVMAWNHLRRTGKDGEPTPEGLSLDPKVTVFGEPPDERELLVLLVRSMERLEQEAQREQPGADALGIGFAMVGLLGGVGVVWHLAQNMADFRRFDIDLSAVQITQFYTQMGFWLLAVIAFVSVGILLVVSTRR